MPRNYVPWILGISLALFMTVTPFVYYRSHYTTYKRLRIVDDGKLYRSGCLTVDGFEHAIKTYGIRTIVNLQEEAPDPNLRKAFLDAEREKESELCRRLGVDLEFLEVELLPPGETRDPKTIDQFLEIMNDPSKQPVLLHCRAGLHRTGILVAIYRMQHHGWSSYEALQELRAMGFGRLKSYVANEYIRQYVVEFEPRPKSVAGRLTSR